MATQGENPRTSKASASQSSLSVRNPATKAQILARIVSLELLYGRQAMSDDERRIWLQTYIEDLGAYTDLELANACRKYRQNGDNRYFPNPGQLLELLKNPFADTDAPHRREVYRASEADHARDAAERKEIDDWFKRQVDNAQVRS